MQDECQMGQDSPTVRDRGPVAGVGSRRPVVGVAAPCGGIGAAPRVGGVCSEAGCHARRRGGTCGLCAPEGSSSGTTRSGCNAKRSAHATVISASNARVGFRSRPSRKWASGCNHRRLLEPIGDIPQTMLRRTMTGRSPIRLRYRPDLTQPASKKTGAVHLGPLGTCIAITCRAYEVIFWLRNHPRHKDFSPPPQTAKQPSRDCAGSRPLNARLHAP